MLQLHAQCLVMWPPYQQVTVQTKFTDHWGFAATFKAELIALLAKPVVLFKPEDITWCTQTLLQFAPDPDSKRCSTIRGKRAKSTCLALVASIFSVSVTSNSTNQPQNQCALTN